eukprot:7946834-Karenia_brevis.AAC.1
MQACTVHQHVASLYRDIADSRSRIKVFAWQSTNDENQFFLLNDFLPQFITHADFEQKRCQLCTLERSKKMWDAMGLWCQICNHALCHKYRVLYGVGCGCESHYLNEHSVLLPRFME